MNIFPLLLSPLLNTIAVLRLYGHGVVPLQTPPLMALPLFFWQEHVRFLWELKSTSERENLNQRQHKEPYFFG